MIQNHCQIEKVEKLNDIAINVIGYDDGSGGLDGKANPEKACYYPLQISQRKCADTMNVLLLSDENNSHYLLVRSLSGLLYGSGEDRNF